MNHGHHIDVVIAAAPSAEPSAALPVEPESAGVAPDPARRVIVLAPTKRAGQAHADALNITPVAIVTPRSPEAARGLTADEIEVAPDLTPEDRDALLPGVRPALDTTEG